MSEAGPVYVRNCSILILIQIDRNNRYYCETKALACMQDSNTIKIFVSNGIVDCYILKSKHYKRPLPCV